MKEVDKNTSVLKICILSQTTRLAMVPENQETCLMILQPSGVLWGMIRIKIRKIQLKCQPKNEYYSRSFEVKVKSSRRCPNAGSCMGTKCRQYDINSKIVEIGSDANNAPGYTYCSEACACAGCSCFYCTSSCMFYRIYAVPTTNEIFEIFSCPVWQYRFEVDAQIKSLDGSISNSKKFNLQVGQKEDWGALEITLIGASSPPLPLLGKTFVTNGKKVVITTVSAAGQPVVGTVGEMQCPDEKSAKEFKCTFPQSLCKCTTQEDYVHCDCEQLKLETLFQKEEYILPINTQGLTLMGNGKDVSATSTFCQWCGTASDFKEI